MAALPPKRKGQTVEAAQAFIAHKITSVQILDNLSLMHNQRSICQFIHQKHIMTYQQKCCFEIF